MLGLLGIKQAELVANKQAICSPCLSWQEEGFCRVFVVLGLFAAAPAECGDPPSRFHDRGDSEGRGWDGPGVHAGHSAAGLAHLLHHAGVHGSHSCLPGHVRTALCLEWGGLWGRSCLLPCQQHLLKFRRITPSFL